MAIPGNRVPGTITESLDVNEYAGCELQHTCRLFLFTSFIPKETTAQFLIAVLE